MLVQGLVLIVLSVNDVLASYGMNRYIGVWTFGAEAFLPLLVQFAVTFRAIGFDRSGLVFRSKVLARSLVIAGVVLLISVTVAYTALMMALARG
jgi:hypothetical protein